VAEQKSKVGDKPEAREMTAAPASAEPRNIGLGVRLVPAGDSDQPRVAQQGGKLPESINGRLATRVALSYETLSNLHQQLGNAIQGLKKAS
jgi:hypothetical protein